MPPFKEKIFSAYEFSPYWTIWRIFRFPQGKFMALFLAILHIFLNVSAKFQLYNIFFWIKLWNDCTAVSKESMNLQLPLYFHSSLIFVVEAICISEHMTENRFGALLEISDAFRFKLMFLVMWFWSTSLIDILESIITRLYDFEKHSG